MKKNKGYNKYDNHSFQWGSLRKLLFQRVHQNISLPSPQPPHYHSPIGTEDHHSPKNYEKGMKDENHFVAIAGTFSSKL